MKLYRLIALFSFVMAVQKDYGQIVSTSYPLPGKTAIYCEYPTANSNVYSFFANTGNNYTWDYSSSVLGVSPRYDTMRYISPGQAQLGASFPTSNIVYLPDTGYHSNVTEPQVYLRKTNTLVEQVGSGQIVNNFTWLPMPWADPLKWYIFPFAYGNFFRDTGIITLSAPGAVVNVPYDSVRYKRIVQRTDSMDGYGTLKLPRLTFNNLYRTSIHDIFVDTFWAYQSGTGWFVAQTQARDLRTLTWLANDTNFVVAQMEFQNDTPRIFISFFPGPFTTRLEVQGLQSSAYIDQVLNPVQVVAKDITTGQINTSFNDTVYLFSNNFGLYSNLNQLAVKAHNGVAVFDSLRIGNGGNMSGYCRLRATSSDTVLIDSSAVIHVFGPPVSTHFNGIWNNIAEYQPLPPFDVNIVDAYGVIDSLITDTVHIGKLAGPGKIMGNTTGVVSVGGVSFDSVRFNYPGTYTLIVYSDALNLADTVVVTVSDVPNINWSFLRLDTMSQFLDRAQQFVWSGNADGFLSGTSRTFWSEISEKFDLGSVAKLKEISFYFSDKYVIGNPDTLFVKVYNAGVQIRPDSFSAFALPLFRNNLPLQLLGSVPLYVDSIKIGDFFNRQPTIVEFTPPIDLSSDFVISLETNSSSIDDTVILWTSTLGDGRGEHRTSRLFHDPNDHGTPTWIPDLFFHNPFDVDFMIVPVLELDTVSIDTVFSHVDNAVGTGEVLVFPNPASGIVTIRLQNFNDSNLNLSLLDVEGREIQNGVIDLMGNSFTNLNLDVSALPGAIYFIHLSSGHSNRVFKLMVSR